MILLAQDMVHSQVLVMTDARFLESSGISFFFRQLFI